MTEFLPGLTGKVALVTGGASGIGTGIARVLASQGTQVAIGDLDRAAAEAIAGALPGNGKGLGVRLDVTDRGSTSRAVDEIEELLGPVDVLVNNAGVSSVASFLDITDQDWDRLMNVNLRGVLVVTQRVLAAMRERRHGRVINISSMAGKEGLPNLAHYCATKFGVIGLTQSLAKEAAPYNVTVNAVCPGVVRTPLWDDPAIGILRDLDGEKGWQAFVDGIPLGRPQSADDIGNACAYLASDLAANITGEALNVSGGQQMHLPGLRAMATPCGVDVGSRVADRWSYGSFGVLGYGSAAVEVRQWPEPIHPTLRLHQGPRAPTGAARPGRPRPVPHDGRRLHRRARYLPWRCRR